MHPARLLPPEPLRSFAGMALPLHAELAEADAKLAAYRAASLAGDILPNVLQAMRVELTYHSNAIEGSTLTLRETQLVLEGRTPGGERSLREIYEARNHDRALRLIEQRIASRPPQTPLGERDLLDVHGVVLTDIDDTYAGRYRPGRVLIAGTSYVPPGSHRFDELMPAVFELANEPSVHPLLRAAELHYNLVAVHPFVDGNGRTARLMSVALLLPHGYPYLIIDVARRGEYLAALDQANAGRIEPFARFVIDSMTRSIHKMVG